jgi:Na+-transporting methylmalonyl-CoA/oxaloacetate decarboxylase gamma subunit
VLIFRGSSLQIVIVLLISLFSVAAYMYLHPYIHEHDNHLAILSQWSITLVIICALIIKIQAINANDDNDKGLGLVLIFLNIVIIGMAIMLAFQNAKERNPGEAGEDDGSKGLFGEDLSDDGDDEEKKNKRKEGKDEEDDEDDDDEMPNEQESKSREADGDETSENTMTSNPLRKNQNKQQAAVGQQNNVADSDIGSDYDEKNDETLSYDSDDDNYRKSRIHRNSDREDDIEDCNSRKDSTYLRNRSILNRVFSARTKPGSLANVHNPAGSHQRSVSSSRQHGVELNTWSSQNSNSSNNAENDEGSPPLHHFYQPNQTSGDPSIENSAVPNKPFSNSRNISTVIDSDDELEEE